MVTNGNNPPLSSLILAGGLSSRMGKDKYALVYHGDPQWKRLIHILETLNIPSFIACRPDQSTTFSQHNCLLDREKAAGPMSPIRSALLAFPATSWLVIACDMPEVNQECLEKLINHRNPQKQATTYFDESVNRPEPLLCIYEAGLSCDLLHQFDSPSKLLSRLDIQLVQTDSKCLTNINTQNEYQRYTKSMLSQG